MGHKSKRYFYEQKDRSRSRERDSHQQTKNSNLKRHSSKFTDNKTASDRLKRAIQEQLEQAGGEKATTNTITQSKDITLAVEEQVTLANAIAEINQFDPFKPRTFVSSRSLNAIQKPINLLEIPLPKDENNWRENPKLLFDSSLYMWDAQQRKDKWLANLLEMRRQLQTQKNQNEAN